MDRLGPWRTARTFADLLELTGQFLAGEAVSFPGWAVGDLDDESDELLPVLEGAVGRGLVTVASQPGRPFSPGHDDRSWAGRAFVGGFIESCNRDSLKAHAEALGLWFRDCDDLEPFKIQVGLRDGTPYLILGSDARDAELEIFQECLGEEARGALADAAFIWVIDPVWGRRDRLGAAFLLDL